MEVMAGEFWTNKQRQGFSLHETPYYGSFQPGLPEFFIQQYSAKGDCVGDPFAGRGTVPLQAWLMGRAAEWRETNPYGKLLCKWKQSVLRSGNKRVIRTFSTAVESFMRGVSMCAPVARQKMRPKDSRLLAFYAPKTAFVIERFAKTMREDENYERSESLMGLALLCVASTGHSSGFLSVRTMPPNMQISAARQLKLNEKHGLQLAEIHPLEISDRLLRKLNSLCRDLEGRVNAERRPEVDTVITSPPFVDLIDYHDTNWLRNSFIDPKYTGRPEIHEKDPESWAHLVWRHILDFAPYAGHYCVEAGRVNKGKTDLIQYLVEVGKNYNLHCRTLYIQDPNASRTSQCWGVGKQQGTTQQQVAVFQFGV